MNRLMPRFAKKAIKSASAMGLWCEGGRDADVGEGEKIDGIIYRDDVLGPLNGPIQYAITASVLPVKPANGGK